MAPFAARPSRGVATSSVASGDTDPDAREFMPTNIAEYMEGLPRNEE
jgi:hypothetical protein